MSQHMLAGGLRPSFLVRDPAIAADHAGLGSAGSKKMTNRHSRRVCDPRLRAQGLPFAQLSLVALG
jgi:hypothetical protein